MMSIQLQIAEKHRDDCLHNPAAYMEAVIEGNEAWSEDNKQPPDHSIYFQIQISKD